MRDIQRRDLLRGAGVCATACATGMAPLRALALEPDGRWPVDRAQAWWRNQPWRVGCSYIPANAVNAIEMWQAPTFCPPIIARELRLAAGIGMNAIRVFLHDLVWHKDGDQFIGRIDQFLAIAARHGLVTLFVLFDSCWDPSPHLGPQLAPRPGVHNSRWVQGPGAAALLDRSEWPRLKAYVTQVVSAFQRDSRVLGWDLWNEPDNLNIGSYRAEEPAQKLERVAELLPLTFSWARGASPMQPLTSGLWQGVWASPEKLNPIQRTQVTSSDVLSFHNYGAAPDFAARIAELRVLRRPILCTEYMARPLGSTVESILPLARRAKVAAFNWGLVTGRTQTSLPWASWQHAYPPTRSGLWYHDLFRIDGRPYRSSEIAVFRREIRHSVNGRTSSRFCPEPRGYAEGRA